MELSISKRIREQNTTNKQQAYQVRAVTREGTDIPHPSKPIIPPLLFYKGTTNLPIKSELKKRRNQEFIQHHENIKKKKNDFVTSNIHLYYNKKRKIISPCERSHVDIITPRCAIQKIMKRRT